MQIRIVALWGLLVSSGEEAPQWMFEDDDRCERELCKSLASAIKITKGEDMNNMQLYAAQ